MFMRNDFYDLFWDFEMSWFTLYGSLESIVIISSIVNNTFISIRIDERVLSFDGTMNSSFKLAFNISRFIVMNFILKIIRCWFFLFLPFFWCLPFCWMMRDSVITDWNDTCTRKCNYGSDNCELLII